MQLNGDLGESFGPWKMGMDEQLMPHLHRANIACGFHASDPVTMDRTVALAVKHGVTIGAHPGYPDLQGFGRRSIPCSHDEIVALITYQVGALAAIAYRHSATLAYVKPHGALYNDMMADDAVCSAVMEAVAGCAGDLSLVMLSTAENSRYLQMAQPLGLPLEFELFADRAYGDDGRLVPRSQPGAVLHDSKQITERMQQLLASGELVSINGKPLRLQADTLCVHGDNPDAVDVARQLRQLLDG
ncbi:5-oxoprolinase subunit PxpA [Porticoccus sp. W117]|uniref:5-oxoprolinase subunit PxpA n=1 Tax=Porticoccus sp. W117 TaxID=3054777 RepID=UPI0025957964|nr:5-oxoprolinase subunit PxpA [Porticoccus sp. W117]MDM3870099.1 5-oxoprolinase subunit PxpA [Porticoccus sp. W117]